MQRRRSAQFVQATLARDPTLGLHEVRPLPGLASSVAPARPTLAALQADHVERVLSKTGGDWRAAARILGVSLRTLQRWEKRTP